VRIAIIGAGGYTFPLRLIRDALAFESTQDATFALTDIDPVALERTSRLAQRMIDGHRLRARVEASVDRRAMLRGADVVLVTFQVGGLDAYRHDVEIPRRYGVDQTVGDTLGPGGVFRGLRTGVVLEAIASDMHELCPEALLIQYANPMAINCWLTADLGIRTVGLCHSVQGTSRMLARILGVEDRRWTFRCAGINHQAWFTRFSCDGVDVTAELRDAVNEFSRGDRYVPNESDTLYGGGNERVRTAIMNLTGYFHTESSHHASEYLPYFRRTPEEAQAFLPERWDYLQINEEHDPAELEREAEDAAREPLQASEEYAAFIIDSLITDVPRVIHGNVRNDGLITNLPDGCCVEVPCLVNANGIQPTHVGRLPAACAALNLGSIAVQSCAVAAAQEHSRELVHAAVALDPLTAAVMPLERIHAMVDEMLAAEAAWLPGFERPADAARARPPRAAGAPVAPA
jgi:alpha-galactosidase